MSLPPFANLFAVYDCDPAILDAIQTDLQEAGEFTEVWRPAPGWVAASAPLPGPVSDGVAVRKNGLAFAEGLDRIEKDFEGALDARFAAVAQMTEERPERLAALPGDFTFIHFCDGGSATAVRSCAGLVPLYLGSFGRRLALATQLGSFVRYLPDEPRMDPLPNGMWARGMAIFPDGRTFLEGVTLLQYGSFARIEPGQKPLVGNYWSPRLASMRLPTTTEKQEHAARLRTILIEALTRDLDPDGGNLLSLSGGVDSTSLAALATRVVGRKLTTFSLLPSVEASLAHEMSFIQPLLDYCGIEHTFKAHYRQSLIFDLWKAADPVVFHVLHPTLCSLPGLLRQVPIHILVGGEWADQICGQTCTLSDWAVHTSLLRVIADSGTIGAARKPVARWCRQRARRILRRPHVLVERDALEDGSLGGLFNGQVNKEFHAWWDKRKKEIDSDRKPWRNLAAEYADVSGFVPMNWEACSALGIRRSLPFFNREVTELVFACHPTELYGPGPKKLLRAALGNDVPRLNLFRADKGGWGPDEIASSEPWQEPLPREPLPLDLQPILNARWYSEAPEKLTYWEYRTIIRLTIFVKSLQSRRAERDSAAPK